MSPVTQAPVAPLQEDIRLAGRSPNDKQRPTQGLSPPRADLPGFYPAVYPTRYPAGTASLGPALNEFSRNPRRTLHCCVCKLRAVQQFAAQNVSISEKTTAK